MLFSECPLLIFFLPRAERYVETTKDFKNLQWLLSSEATGIIEEKVCSITSQATPPQRGNTQKGIPQQTSCITVGFRRHENENLMGELYKRNDKANNSQKITAKKKSTKEQVQSICTM